ncbi:MAG: cytochrome P450 [Acidimicrobiia bacterium]
MTLDAQKSEADRFRELYDVERYVTAIDGGVLVEDPYPAFAELRARGEVHEGSVASLLGYPGRHSLHGDAPIYSAFSFAANDRVLRENDVFSSSYYAGFTTQIFGRSILEMGGDEHRRNRALVQRGFSIKRSQWWIDRWIAALVDEAVSAFEHEGRAELNAELCARIPLQTITSSFGLTRDEALDFRESGGMVAGNVDMNDAMSRAERSAAMLRRVIEDRRAVPQDDVITMLVESELEEDGTRHLLTDDEIFGFARLILTAGSGTTWRQLGILLLELLNDPESLDAVRDDRTLLRRAVDEAVRLEPTDPIFRRLVTRDVTLAGVDIPAGAVIEMNLGAANRDPARWDDPERFDVRREPKPHLGFAGGPHVCLGMHVARAEMLVAMNAVLDRLPNIRFDPEAPPPRIIGLEHRGPNRIPVVFG